MMMKPPQWMTLQTWLFVPSDKETAEEKRKITEMATRGQNAVLELWIADERKRRAII